MNTYKYKAGRFESSGKVFIMEKRSGRESIKRIGYIYIMPIFLFTKHILCTYFTKLKIASWYEK